MVGWWWPDTQNTKICCGFFWTLFCSSDRRQYYSERSWSDFANNPREGPDNLSTPVHVMDLISSIIIQRSK